MDVIIVGAGPVGLMLACQLQRRGVSYRLLETRPRRDYWCKALGVSPRTLEIFDQMGCLDEALNRGLFFRAVNTVVAGQVVARVETDPEQYPYGAIALGQYDSEEVLEQQLRRQGGTIERGETVTEVSASPDGVEAVLASGERVQGSYLVGCDGAHSLVRKAMGVSFEGGRYPQVFLLGDIEMQWPHPHGEVWKLVLMEDGEVVNFVVVVPVPGNPRRYRLSMAAPPEYWDEGVELPEANLELIERLAGPALPAGTKLSNLRWASFYRISHRLASRYRVGRLFIAGDAAHIHPPIGGLGMNTGLQDAYNLGWKLARGGEQLLESYHLERHKVGEQVVALTASRMEDATSGKARDEAAEERANTQLEISYAGGPLAFGAVPAGQRGAGPGERLDFVDKLRRLYIRRSSRLIDFMRDGELHLFGYGGGWPEFRSLSAHLRASLGPELRCWAVSDSFRLPELNEEVPVLQDARGRAHGAWGDGPGAILVRPDGHVAWRGGMSGDEGLERALTVLSGGA